MLALPDATNATVMGRASRGTIKSDHYITLRPIETKLNNFAWKRFKQEVYGTLGTGEAEIQVTTQRGNIVITDSKTI
jgi:hypothetical protein